MSVTRASIRTEKLAQGKAEANQFGSLWQNKK